MPVSRDRVAGLIYKAPTGLQMPPQGHATWLGPAQALLAYWLGYAKWKLRPVAAGAGAGAGAGAETHAPTRCGARGNECNCWQRQKLKQKQMLFASKQTGETRKPFIIQIIQLVLALIRPTNTKWNMVGGVLCYDTHIRRQFVCARESLEAGARHDNGSRYGRKHS